MAGMHFTIDAEEAERLELSMDIIEALVADDALFANGWSGFGLAVQAYQKRAVHVCDWVARLARRHGRRLFVRLVKGAYWDSEIKLSQVGGYADYPVFTRKVATDVSYLACAAKLFAASDVIYPAFATHNAYTIGAIKALSARPMARPCFEFQRLHGMGEDVYEELAKLEGNARTRVRIYAPVGGHKDLLAYLVRRLLENGANSSFVNRMADADVPVSELTGDPVAELAALRAQAQPGDPAARRDLPRPREQRRGRPGRSAGARAAAGRTRRPRRRGNGTPRRHSPRRRARRRSRSPRPPTARLVGTCRDATAAEVAEAIARAEAIQPGWNALGGEKRALLLEEAADAFEAHTAEFISPVPARGGQDAGRRRARTARGGRFPALLRGRGAAAVLARHPRCPARPAKRTACGWPGAGCSPTISPWNFPLAIFIGPAAAALAAGNTVVAKPAEQTPLIAALAVRLCHEAGIPHDVLQLLPGGGEVGPGDHLRSAHRRGRLHRLDRDRARDQPRARRARRADRHADRRDRRAERDDRRQLRAARAGDPRRGGQRRSRARASAASALRVLYLQDDVADAMLAMIRGAFEALVIGDPRGARHRCRPGDRRGGQAPRSTAHVAAWQADARSGSASCRAGCAKGHFVAPTIIEIDSIARPRGRELRPRAACRAVQRAASWSG